MMFFLRSALFALILLVVRPALAQVGPAEPGRLSVEQEWRRLSSRAVEAEGGFASGRSEAPKRIRFLSMLGAGTLGAAAGGGVLLLLAKPLREMREHDREDRYREDEAVVLALYLLSWVGSVGGVLAAAPDPLESVESLFIIGSSSFLASLIGTGIIATLGVESRPVLLAGFAVGAGAGAALGYLIAHRGAHDRSAAPSLFNLGKGRWRMAVPSVRLLHNPARPARPVRAVSLLKVRF